MININHLLISALLIAGFVLLDLMPQLRAKKREMPAIWFGSCVYALSFALDILVGFGVKLNLGLAFASLFSPLTKLFGGEAW